VSEPDTPDDEGAVTEVLSPTVQSLLLVDALEIAVDVLVRRVARLPVFDPVAFNRAIAGLLTDMSSMEATIVSAARTLRQPELLRLLGRVRAVRSQMVIQAGSARGATLAQRVAAAREMCRLTVGEVAATYGVAVAAVEADRPVAASVTAALERFVTTIAKLDDTRTVTSPDRYGVT
jgi:hypothetical protein